MQYYHATFLGHNSAVMSRLASPLRSRLRVSSDLHMALTDNPSVSHVTCPTSPCVQCPTSPQLQHQLQLPVLCDISGDFIDVCHVTAAIIETMRHLAMYFTTVGLVLLIVSAEM